MYWLLLGLLAPEIITYTAWYQLRAAQKLNTITRRKLHSRSSQTSPTESLSFPLGLGCCSHQDARCEPEDIEHGESNGPATKRRYKWTMVHSFYVTMGGFVFDTSDEDVNFLPNNRERLTLTPRGLLYLLDQEPDLIPDLSREHIHDKSKAGKFIKTLVCIQTIWFCVQVITRAAQSLAVSLLELNVFGHAICALLMYLLWWNKPMDIEEPTVLCGSFSREMCALMCMRSFTDSNDNDGYYYRNRLCNPKAQPELPYGVRYGGDSPGKLAETLICSDEDSERVQWYRLDKILGWIAFDPPKNFMPRSYMVELDLPAQQQLLVLPVLPSCRLDWIVSSSSDEEHESRNTDITYPVNYSDRSDTMEREDGIINPLHTPASGFTGHEVQYKSCNFHTSGTGFFPSNVFITSSCLDGFRLTLGTWTRTDMFQPWEPRPNYAPTSVTLSCADVVRWKLCARALQRYYPNPQWVLSYNRRSHQDFPAYRSVYDHSPDWPSLQHMELHGVDSFIPFATFFGLSFAGLVYGGLHLLAWDAPINSETERFFWRSSGVIVASSGLFVFLSFVVGYFWGLLAAWIMPFWKDLLTRLSGWRMFLANRLMDTVSDLKLLMYWFPILCFFGAYIGARIYLVVGSFIQLAHLPDSAYLLPTWSQYYPHIT
jgi:hypothetical protein